MKSTATCPAEDLVLACMDSSAKLLALHRMFDGQFHVFIPGFAEHLRNLRFVFGQFRDPHDQSPVKLVAPGPRRLFSSYWAAGPFISTGRFNCSI